MLARLALLLSLAALAIGQIPRAVTVCQCTGEVAGSQASLSDTCATSVQPKCGTCTPAPKKACFVTKADPPPPALVAHLVDIECPVVLARPFEVVLPLLQPQPGPRVWLVLPRIREPDIGGHPLRAPPSLA